MAINRILLIVLDGVGIGAMPDAKQYGDEGAHTLRHIAEKTGGLRLPTLEKLGLGAISEIPGMAAPKQPMASYGKLAEVSAGKDTTTGHWEMVGIHLTKPFPVFSNGFPEELINALIQKSGIGGVLGNKAASGTEIIQELGQKHLRTKFPIVYTSADSVFQIACHEEIFPLKKLYDICEIARKLCNPCRIGRVIARPFTGASPATFQRTPYRKDYGYKLPGAMVLDFLKEKSIDVIGIGKIEDIYNRQGISRAIRTKSNLAGIESSVAEMKGLRKGLVFTNLVDFDQLYGHRNNVEGYARALEEFDQKLPEILEVIGKDGLLIITADHGNDPTHPGTDHTREYVPLLVYGSSVQPKNLGTRKTLSDIGQTMADIFDLKPLAHGKSFL